MTTDNSKPRLLLTLSLTQRLVLLLCLFLVGFFLVGLLSAVVGVDTTPRIRIVTVIQDLFMFVMPAVVMAVMVTRQPATLLDLDTSPKLLPLLCAIVVMVVSMPAMEWVIGLNARISLPQGVEGTLRDLEESANASVTMLLGAHDIKNLVMSILIMGVLAALSEELLFRGALQRLLVTGGVNRHAAVWISAAIFSMMHMQVYGFVPRMLLGAFFGYTLLWTRSLWVPILLHIFNNILFLVLQYNGAQQTSVSAALVAGSVVLTAGALIMLYRVSVRTAAAE